MFGGDPFGGMHGMGGMSGMGGMNGMGGGRRTQAPQKVEVPLNLSLEELYTGTTKKRKVTRTIVDSASGKSMKVEETLEIPVKAGWKNGTKITFAGKGDELPGRPAQDLVFVVRQLSHPVFQREGDDLIAHSRITLAQALTEGNSINVKALDNRILRVPLKEVVYPQYERVVLNEGMPISKQPGKKGNLRIRFDVQYPKKQFSGEEAATLQRVLGTV